MRSYRYVTLTILSVNQNLTNQTFLLCTLCKYILLITEVSWFLPTNLANKNIYVLYCKILSATQICKIPLKEKKCTFISKYEYIYVFDSLYVKCIFILNSCSQASFISCFGHIYSKICNVVLTVTSMSDHQCNTCNSPRFNPCILLYKKMESEERQKENQLRAHMQRGP